MMGIQKLFSSILRKKSKSMVRYVALLAVCLFLTALSPNGIPESIRRLSLFGSKMIVVMTPVPPIPTWTLPNSAVYPVVASNTASLSPSQTEAMVLKSLSLEITNIDFHLGGSEREGAAAVLHAVPRDTIFLVTKIDKPPADMANPAAVAKLVQSTIDIEWPLLGVDTVDVLLLKDSTSCTVMQAQWAVLERLLEQGKTHALGTYNCCQFFINCILQTALTLPALNYVMRYVGM